MQVTALFLLLIFTSSVAAQTVTVQRTIEPAWLVRNKIKTELKIDSVLKIGDQLITRENGKALFHLHNAHELFLGSDTVVRINQDSIELISGHIRYTSKKSNKPTISTKIKTGSALIDTKNSDLWIESSKKYTRIILLAGSFEVNHDSGVMIASEPHTVLILKPDNTAELVAPHPINKLDLKPLLAKTTLAKNSSKQNQTTEPILEENILDTNSQTKTELSKEKYIVYVFSSANHKKADEVNKKLQTSGHPSQLVTSNTDGSVFYRVGVNNFDSIENATAFSKRIEKSMKLKNPEIEVMQ